MDRLTEVLVVMLVRELVSQGVVKQGMLAGMSHPKLYSNTSGFARAFRKKTGLSPKEWQVSFSDEDA